jgi:hypothetical protein
LIAGVVVLSLLLLGGLASNTGSRSTSQQGSSAATGPVSSFGAGTYAVGTDVVPGTYSSNGPDGSNFTGCYWARLKDTSGNLESITANNIDQGPSVVTISANDVAFKTQGCSTWHKR